MSCLPPPNLLPSLFPPYPSNTSCLLPSWLCIFHIPSDFYVFCSSFFLSFQAILPSSSSLPPPPLVSTVPIVLQTFLLFVLIYPIFFFSFPSFAFLLLYLFPTGLPSSPFSPPFPAFYTSFPSRRSFRLLFISSSSSLGSYLHDF